jgi:drug/metabolite transporter (DMT)-like permease
MKVAIAFVLMITCTVAANLLLKMGASTSSSRLPALEFINWKLIAGVSAFGFAALLYIWLLRILPLNVAQSFAAAQFIAVSIASALILGEQISGVRWMGIVLIGIGIAVVGVTVAQGESAIHNASDISGHAGM